MTPERAAELLRSIQPDGLTRLISAELRAINEARRNGWETNRDVLERIAGGTANG